MIVMTTQQNEPVDRRLPLAVTATEAAAIEAWRHKHMMPSRNEALRWLIRLGLKAKLGLSVFAAVVLGSPVGLHAQSVEFPRYDVAAFCRTPNPIMTASGCATFQYAWRTDAVVLWHAARADVRIECSSASFSDYGALKTCLESFSKD